MKVYGSMDVVKSDWLELQSTVCADSPVILVAVIGIDERRQLEHNICDLINKRDRLLTLTMNALTSHATHCYLLCDVTIITKFTETRGV